MRIDRRDDVLLLKTIEFFCGILDLLGIAFSGDLLTNEFVRLKKREEPGVAVLRCKQIFCMVYQRLGGKIADVDLLVYRFFAVLFFLCDL